VIAKKQVAYLTLGGHATDAGAANLRSLRVPRRASARLLEGLRRGTWLTQRFQTQRPF
jgi:hypothetical protein